MNQISNWLAGIGMLIGIYLFLSNANATVKIIDGIGSNMINGIQVLQGRAKSNTTRF